MKTRFVVRSWFHEGVKKQYFGVYDLFNGGWIGGAITYTTQKKAQNSCEAWQRSRDKRIRERTTRRIFLLRDPSKSSSTPGNKFFVEVGQ